MSKLLLDEAPLQVQPSLATAIGLNEAIALQQLHWILNNQNMGKDIDGIRYIYMSIQDWRKGHFPFWSAATIQRTFDCLEKMNIIKSRNDLNQAHFDRTKWYAIDYVVFDEIEKTFETNGRLIEYRKMINGHRKMRKSLPQDETTIPESSSESSSESEGASKNDAHPTPESPQSKAQREKYAQAIAEFNAHEEHKADPKKAERQYVEEAGAMISRILGMEGYIIKEHRLAAQRMFNLRIPLEFVRDKEADYRNGGGEDFSNPDATAFWVANRYEKDFALSKIEGNTHGQIARTYDDYIEKRTAELRGFGFTDSEIADDLRTQGLAPRAEDVPKPSAQAVLVRETASP